MKLIRHWGWGISLGVLAVAIAVPAIGFQSVTAATKSADESGIKWHNDLMEAHRISVKEKRPMLIVFGAEWCRYCHKLERESLRDPEIVKLVNSEFVAVHLDFDAERKVADILEVKSLPTAVVLSDDADLLGTVVGYLNAGEYRKSLSAALDYGKTLKE